MYFESPFRVWADDLASDKPAPGGGSAAALVGVSGCSLLSMVANFTIGKKKYAQVEAEMKSTLREVEKARARLLELVDEDVAQYSVVTAAYSMPKETPEQKAARSAAIQEALKVALSVPLEACKLVGRAIGFAPDLLAKGNPNLASDVGVGVQCLQCAYRGAWLNVEINLASIKDADYVSKIRAELEPISSEVEEIGNSVWDRTVRIIKKI